MKPKHLIQLFIGILISAVALWFVFRGVDLRQMLGSIKSFNYYYLIHCLLLFYLGIVLRAWRWQWLFRPKHRIPFTHATAGIFICFAFNSVFPARAGEFARAYLVGKQDKTGFSTAFGTVVAERLLDSLTLLPCLVLALAIAPIAPGTTLPIDVFGKIYVLTGAQFLRLERSIIVTCLFLLAAILAVVIPVTRGWILGVIHSIPLLPHAFRVKVERIVHQFAEGVNFFRSPLRVVGLFVFSFILWATTAYAVFFLAKGFPGMHMTLVQAFAMIVIVCIFILPPAAPGYWGFFEAGVIFSVVIMGVTTDQTLARSYAILLHLTQWVPIVVIGLPWAWFAHVSLSDVRQLKAEAPPASDVNNDQSNSLDS